MGNRSSQQAASSPSTKRSSSVSSVGRGPPRAAFDSKTLSGDIQLSGDGKSVFRDSSKSGTAFVLLNQSCSCGVYRWQFVLDDDSGASTCLGVASLPMTPVGSDADIFNCKSFRVCRSYSGQLYECGKLLDKKVGPFWQSGTSVTFLLDMTAGILTFSKEGGKPTEIFRGIAGPVAPLVAFYASFSKRVTLVDFKQLQDVDGRSSSLSLSQSPQQPLAVAVQCRTPEELLQSCTSILDVRFDVDGCEGPLEISPDGLTLSRSEDMYGAAYCTLNRRIESGVAAWEFTVHADAGASSLIGVASEDMRMPPNNCSLFLSPHFSVWRSYEGRVYHKGIEMTDQVDLFDWSSDCDTIGIVVDLDKGNMYFTCDGHILSVVLTGIQGPVYPVVGFYAGMPKCISISQYREAGDSNIEYNPSSEQKQVSFQRATLVGHVRATNNGNTLVCSHDDIMNSYCVLDDPCISGVHTWTVVIEQDTGASTCIGLTTKPVDVPVGDIYESHSMWLYRSYLGQLYSRGLELASALDPFWQPGTVVELTFDADSGKLAISRNGTNYGVVFDDIPTPVHLIVAFYAQMDKMVSLTHYSHGASTLSDVRQASGLQLNDLSQHPSTRDGVWDSVLPVAVDQHARNSPKHCLVCKKQPVDTFLRPCGHSSTCWADADRLVQSGGTCPRCGVRVVAVFNQL